MSKSTRTILDVLLFFVAFMVIQAAVTIVVGLIDPQWVSHPTAIIISTSVSSLLTILLFFLARWTPLRRDYLRSKPWKVLVWAAVLTFGTIIPSEVLNEAIGAKMPEEMEQVFTHIMRSPWGYLVVGILAPVAEEVVFRGAILRVLLKVFSQERRWVAIMLSALLFAAAHGNMAQIPHAFLIGLLLGWMYYRTGSIFPGLVMHWVNNSIAYVTVMLMPGLQDANLIDLLQGDHMKEMLYVGFSLFVMLPAIYQLHLNMKRTPQEITENEDI